MTAAWRKSSIGWVSVSRSTRSGAPRRVVRNRRIDSAGPSSASGGMIAFTRDPSRSRASTIGLDSSMRRPTELTIRSMISNRCWSSLKTISVSSSLPLRSMYAIESIDEDVGNVRVAQQNLERPEAEQLVEYSTTSVSRSPRLSGTVLIAVGQLLDQRANFGFGLLPTARVRRSRVQSLQELLMRAPLQVLIVALALGARRDCWDRKNRSHRASSSKRCYSRRLRRLSKPGVARSAWISSLTPAPTSRRAKVVYEFASLLWLSRTKGRPRLSASRARPIVARKYIRNRTAHDTLHIGVANLGVLVVSTHDNIHGRLPVALPQSRDQTPGAAHGGQFLIGDNHNLVRVVQAVEDRRIRLSNVQDHELILTGGTVEQSPQRSSVRGQSWPGRTTPARSSPILLRATMPLRNASSIRSMFSSASATENLGSTPQEQRGVSMHDVQVEQEDGSACGCQNGRDIDGKRRRPDAALAANEANTLTCFRQRTGGSDAIVYCSQIVAESSVTNSLTPPASPPARAGSRRDAMNTHRSSGAASSAATLGGIPGHPRSMRRHPAATTTHSQGRGDPRWSNESCARRRPRTPRLAAID